MDQEYTSLDLRALLGLLKHNVVRLILAALWGMALGLAVCVLVLPRTYQAAATLVVSTGQPQAAVTGEQLSTARQLVDTYAVLLTNDSLLGEVIRAHGLDDTVDSLRKRISAQAVDGTQVMRVTVRDKSPLTALAVLATMVERAPEILAGAAQGGAVEVVSPPWVDETPVSPKLLYGAVLGAGLGFLACLVLLMAGQLMADTFADEDDVERRLALPVLGVIPAVDPRRAGADRAEEAYRESYSFLRAALRGLPQKGGCRRLVVASAAAGEGKSTVAAGLARCLAAEGRVLLLETDLRAGPQQGPGLAEILEEGRGLNECVEHLPGDGYWLLCAGGPAPDPAELLDSGAMEGFLASLEGSFDHVVMDTAPALAAADAAVLGRQADAVLLVVRCKKGARFGQARRAVRRLQTSGAVVAGVVLNGCDAKELARGGKRAR